MKKHYLLCALPLLVATTMSSSLMAICSGHSTAVDEYYSTYTPVANWNPEQGWDWQVETTSAGVEITVQFLDNYVGMAAPQLFVFDDNGVLIGNPIPMNWAEATKTATYTITGKANGDKVVFLVQIAYADHVIFTERIKYVVGSTCAPEEQPTIIGSCSGRSTATDPTYTNADAAADANAFTEGYEWKVTTTDQAVEIEVNFLDRLEGFAAPYIFLFDENGVLQGNDQPMELFGKKALYTLTGKQIGDEINFLVKIAYTGHVAFTERISYTVGDNCQETSVNETLNDNKVVFKELIDGNIYINIDGERYNIMGAKTR